MIQAPQNYGMQQPAQATQQRRPAFTPSYNAVQINLDTPTLNAPPAMPYYPPVNMEPYQQTATAAPQQGEQTATAAPQYQPPTATAPIPQQPTQTQVPPPVLDTQTAPAIQQPQVEIKPAEEKTSQSLADEAFKGLSSADFDTQALAMEDIAKKGLNNQADVVPYVQENIFDRLIDIMNTDSSQLAGPTPKQAEVRAQMAQNDKAIDDATKAGQDPAGVKLPFTIDPKDAAEAEKLSPYEQAERNKEYAMFTTAILQKTYADELAKQTGTVPPVTELPGSKAVITTLKTNENPDMRQSAIDALRYVQRPEYNADLTTLYGIAQNDADPNVSEAATAALASLNAPEASTAAPQPQPQQA